MSWLWLFLPIVKIINVSTTHFIMSNCGQIRKINSPWPESNQFWTWSGYINMWSFRPSLAFPRKSSETPDLIDKVKNFTKITTINRTWIKPNQFWRWSGFTSILNFRASLLCVLQKISGNLSFRTDGMMLTNAMSPCIRLRRWTKIYKIGIIWNWKIMTMILKDWNYTTTTLRFRRTVF